MQSYITMFVLLILLAVTTQAKAPTRIAIAPHSPGTSGTVNIDVLITISSDSGITLTKSVKTSNSGMLSIVLDETDFSDILPCTNCGIFVKNTEKTISLSDNISITDFPGG